MNSKFLKKISLFSIIIFILLIGCSGKEKDGKKVSNIKEFIQALDSNTVILVKPGEYIFTDSYIPEDLQDDIEYEELDTLSSFYDTTYIHDVENLKIIGLGTPPPKFIQIDLINPVLAFRNVDSLYLENLRFEHFEPVGCEGEVINIEDSKNITLVKLRLLGSGYEGLFLDSVENIMISNSLITQCSGDLSTFYNVRNLLIDSCRFIENELYFVGFSIFNSTITFKNSFIESDFPYYEDFQMYSEDEGALFSIDDELYYDEYYEDYDTIYEYDEYDDELYSYDPIHTEIIFVNTVINNELINNKYEKTENVEEDSLDESKENYYDY